MLLAIVATVVAILATVFVIFANENAAAPSATFRGGWVLGAAWLIAAWAWLSWIFG